MNLSNVEGYAKTSQKEVKYRKCLILKQIAVAHLLQASNIKQSSFKPSSSSVRKLSFIAPDLSKQSSFKPSSSSNNAIETDDGDSDVSTRKPYFVVPTLMKKSSFKPSHSSVRNPSFVIPTLTKQSSESPEASKRKVDCGSKS